MNNSGEFRILFALVCFLAVAFCSRDVCYADMVTIKAESLEEDIRKDDCLSKFVKENVPSDAYLVDSEFIQNLLEIKKGEISDISAKFNSCVYSFVTDNDEGPFMCYTITDLYTKNATRLTKDDTLSISTDDCIYMDIENGVRRAKSGTYSMLSHRMSIPESIYDADIIPNTNADLILAEKVKDNMNKGKVEQSIRLTMKLEKQLGSSMSFLENKQFVYGIRDFCYLLSETITPLDYLKRVDKLLKMPVRKKGERGFEEYYTRREIILLIYKAIAYNKAGNNDVSLNLIEKLWDHMLDDNVNLIYRKDEVLLILYQWGKLLYEENDYSGALEKARLGIRYCYFIDCAEKISDFMDVVMNIYKNTYSKSKVVDFYYGKGELDEASILRQFYDDTRVKSLNHVLV